MRIYDGSVVDIDVFEGDILVGHVLGRTGYFHCPFCGEIQHFKPLSNSKCGQCGAKYKQSVVNKEWYWERNVQGEVNSLKEKLRKRNRKVRSLRRELAREAKSS